MSRLTREGTAQPVSRDKFSGANADREIFIFAVQLTTSRIGNLTRLIHTLASVTIHTQRYLPSSSCTKGNVPYEYCVVFYRTARVPICVVQQEYTHTVLLGVFRILSPV